jgi:hypothetical protein
MLMIVDIGDKVRASVTFTKANVDTNPTVVTVKILKGDGTTELTYSGNIAALPAEIVLDAVGQLHHDVSIDDVPGVWTVRWFATGNVEAATELTFTARDSAFGSPLSTT